MGKSNQRTVRQRNICFLVMAVVVIAIAFCHAARAQHREWRGSVLIYPQLTAK
jgi:hypothetical protein